jgi:hypothetical protein
MVRRGLEMITAGLAAVILAAYCSAGIAAFLRFSPAGEAGFIFLGLFGGGLCSGFGLLVTLAGLVKSEVAGTPVRLLPVVVVLAVLSLVFLVLMVMTSRSPEPPRLRPGETITI